MFSGSIGKVAHRSTVKILPKRPASFPNVRPHCKFPGRAEILLLQSMRFLPGISTHVVGTQAASQTQQTSSTSRVMLASDTNNHYMCKHRHKPSDFLYSTFLTPTTMVQRLRGMPTTCQILKRMSNRTHTAQFVSRANSKPS
jgi:hypothetical protein